MEVAWVGVLVPIYSGKPSKHNSKPSLITDAECLASRARRHDNDDNQHLNVLLEGWRATWRWRVAVE